jgi:hypothetical protein
MNTDKQRIAIAEACGWKCPCGFKEAFACWVRPSAMEHQTEWLPDYLNDLNAMHEAEKTLDYNDLNDMEESVSFHFGVTPFHSTAAQRAEAFLRTIGKWEEGK